MLGDWIRLWERREMAKAGVAGLILILFASLTVAGAQQTAGTPAPPPGGTASQANSTAAPNAIPGTETGDYIVSPEDLLEVNVMDVPEVTRAYRVSSNGFLTLPLLPQPIAAAGNTLGQLSHLIAAKFREAGMLNNAEVTVALRETRLHTVLVSGEVRRPQTYTVYGPTRLLDLIGQAGGLADEAGDEAVITRGPAGVRADLAEATQPEAISAAATGQSFTVNIRMLMQTGDDKSNILLYPGDRVTVQRAALVYVLGAVLHPGGYVLNEAHREVTVLKALAMAGDVTYVAKKQRITLLRRNPNLPGEKRDEIPVNYKAMVKGQVADVKMKPDDILYVPESNAIKAWHTSINAMVSSAALAAPGLIIYH